MAVGATLVTSLAVGKLAKFKSDLRKAHSEVKSFAKKSSRDIKAFALKTQRRLTRMAKKIPGPVKKAIAAIAAAVTGGFALMVAAQTRAARELSAWSSTLDLSVDKLQKWQFAAESVGISSEKLTDIFKDVNDKLGDFALTGGGEAATVLKKLGFAAKDFRGLKADQALLKIASATEKLGTQERIFVFEAIANDLSKLSPLLDDNAAGLKKFGDRFDELGLGLSRDAVSALTDLGSALRNVWKIFTTFVGSALAEWAPAITKLIEKFESLTAAVGGASGLGKAIGSPFETLDNFLYGEGKASQAGRALLPNAVKSDMNTKQNTKDGVKEGIEAATPTLAGSTGDAVANALKSLPSFSSKEMGGAHGASIKMLQERLAKVQQGDTFEKVEKLRSAVIGAEDAKLKKDMAKTPSYSVFGQGNHGRLGEQKLKIEIKTEKGIEAEATVEGAGNFGSRADIRWIQEAARAESK